MPQKKSVKPKQILITGGAGFLGSNLANLLLNSGHKVTVMDDLSSGSWSNLDKNNPALTLIKHDVRRPFPANKLSKITEVYHLASPASPEDYYREPLFTLETSSVGIKNALEFVKANRAKLMFSSTSEVYGDPKVHPQTETYWGNVNPNGPRSCYDEAKRYAESYLVTFRNVHNVDAKIVRIFNTYGPNMRPNDGRVVSNFILSCLQNDPITIYGNGSQTRSFCFVDDLVDGFVKMMASKELGPINLGNPAEYTVKQLAETIKRKTKSSSKIVYKPLPKDDPAKRKPDIKLAQTKLKWQPKVDLEEGLDKTIAYFQTLQKGKK